jgi:hypothetical protein
MKDVQVEDGNATAKQEGNRARPVALGKLGKRNSHGRIDLETLVLPTSDSSSCFSDHPQSYGISSRGL